jgi:decaprenylphospho-beta-D-ribofuranose 2-oxidase
VSDRVLLSGWGGTAPTSATVVPVSDAGSVPQAVKAADGRGLVARGLGRSYGDAAQNAGGTVLDMTGAARLLRLDGEKGIVEAEAGTSLHDLMRYLVPMGWFVPVTPGTRFVTLGGAVAADIHGKNHHVDGSFAQHVLSLELVTPDGTVRDIGPDRDPELFWATAGGMGLTGVITRVTLQLVPVDTSWMLVDTERATDLDDLMDRLVRGDADYRYSVAWIDLLARGRSMGRAVLTRGDHAGVDDLPPRRRRDPRAFDAKPLLTLPSLVPNGLLRRSTVTAFNELWFRKAPRERRGEAQRISTFFHPLDGVLEWNRVYGPAGFVQYQYAVPDGAEDVVRQSVEAISSAGAPSFLAVLKRFGPGNAGPLSFPQAGWTLALDLPAGAPGLAPLFALLDDLVLAAGGRLYLAKDARVPPELLPRMYPRLEEWRAVRERVDPDRRLVSDLARRLSL